MLFIVHLRYCIQLYSHNQVLLFLTVKFKSVAQRWKIYWAASLTGGIISWSCFTGCIFVLSPPGVAITSHLHPFPPADPTLGLEAQQKYSTGYIQCMHEVHNMLLTCDWMDKTLGSRLLNHLLKSLPRSTDERPLQPTPRQEVPPPASQGMRLPATPLRADPLAGRQHQREGPTCHVAGHRERPALQSSQLGMLEMWRPWWTGGLMILVVYFC